jgi:hypothetical protein
MHADDVRYGSPRADESADVHAAREGADKRRFKRDEPNGITVTAEMLAARRG